MTNSKVRSGGVPILVLDAKAWDAISNIGNEFIPIPAQMYQKQSIISKLFEIQKLDGGLLLENSLNKEVAKKMKDVQTIIKNQTDDPGKNYYQNN